MTRSMCTSRGFMRILLTKKKPEWRKKPYSPGVLEKGVSL